MRAQLLLILVFTWGLAPRLLPAADQVSAQPACVTQQTPLILHSAAAAVGAALHDLDQDLAATAQTLVGLDLSGALADSTLSRFLAAHQSFGPIATLGPDGIMLLVQPEGAGWATGPDQDGPSYIQTLLRTRRPVLSGFMGGAPGDATVVLAQPVLGPDNQLLGALGLTLSTRQLIGPPLADLLKGLPVEIWVMQLDGRILYDVDSAEVGRLLFSDPVYQSFPELLDLGRRIAADPEGCGTYAYPAIGTGELVHKDAWWVTLTLDGTPWRLVSVHPSQVTGTAPPAAIAPFSLDDLRALADDPGLIDDLRQGRQDAVMVRFQDLAATHSGVYSLTWIDAAAVNRYGYPRNDSLFNVDLRTQTDPASVAIVHAIAEHKELVVDDPLIEGGDARYTLVPVMDGVDYLGSLLWIQRQ